MKTVYSGIAVLFTIALLGGCNPKDAGNLTQDTRAIASHAGEAIGNAQLAARVNTALAQRKGVDMSGLHVDAQDGVVTLGGHVRNKEEKHRVVDTVDGIRGVDKIVDNIHVQP